MPVDTYFQSHPVAAKRRLLLRLTNAGASQSGVTPSSSELQILKNGASGWANSSGTWSEPTSGGGAYQYEFAQSELDTPGDLLVRIIKTGVVDEWWYKVYVEPAVFATVVTDAGNSATQFKTDLTSTVTNKYRNGFGTFVDGTLIDEVVKITAYDGTTKIMTFSSPGYTTTPTVGDHIRIINQ